MRSDIAAGWVEPSAGSGVVLTWRDVQLAIVLATFFFASAWNTILSTPIGEPPDEWPHLSYVHEVAVEGRLIPNYAESTILPSRTSPNYLRHPPLYYSAMGLVGAALGWDPVRDYKAYRGLSAALVAIGVMLWALTGRALGLSPTRVVVLVAALAAIPMFPYLAGSVNNDNLAYLGVAMVSLALTRLDQWPRASYVLGAAGVVITMLSKATASVFLCAFFVAWALPQWKDPNSVIRSRRFLLAVSAAVVIVAGYYAFSVFAFGSLSPAAGSVYEQKAPAEAVAIGPFAIHFVRAMVQRLPMILSHAPLEPLGLVLGNVFWVMLSAPLLAWVFSLRGRAGSQYPLVARAFLQALAVTVLIHLFVVWDAFHKTGLDAAMQPRYYNYSLPGLFMFCFAAAGRSRFASLAFWVFALSVAWLVAAAPPKTARMQASAHAAGEIVSYPRAQASRLEVGIAITPGRAGYVDALEMAGGIATASGWAVNQADLSPARGIYVIVGDRVIGSAETGLVRPDVARALQTPTAAESGFKFRIQGLPVDLDKCDVQLAAEQTDGTLTVLPNSACPASSP